MYLFLVEKGSDSVQTLEFCCVQVPVWMGPLRHSEGMLFAPSDLIMLTEWSECPLCYGSVILAIRIPNSRVFLCFLCPLNRGAHQCAQIWAYESHEFSAKACSAPSFTTTSSMDADWLHRHRLTAQVDCSAMEMKGGIQMINETSQISVTCF